jgi:hypothetical protein
MGYELAPAADLPSLLDGSPFTAATSLTKLCVSSSHLYAVMREAHTIAAFSIDPDGKLVPVDGSMLNVDDPDGRVLNGAVCSSSLRTPPARFRRGDANADGAVNLADALFTMNHLFRGGDAPACPDAADADDTEGLDIGDPSSSSTTSSAAAPHPGSRRRCVRHGSDE